MPLLTVFTDPQGGFQVEEDSRGRLWLTVRCRGAGELDELHRLLTPGEARAFRRSPAALLPRARFLLQSPARHYDRREEEDYRRQ